MRFRFVVVAVSLVVVAGGLMYGTTYLGSRDSASEVSSSESVPEETSRENIPEDITLKALPGCTDAQLAEYNKALIGENYPKAYEIVNELCEQTPEVHLEAIDMASRMGVRYGMIKHGEALIANPGSVEPETIWRLKLYLASAYATASNPNLERATELIEGYFQYDSESVDGIDTYLWIAERSGDFERAIELCDHAYALTGEFHYVELKESLRLKQELGA